MPYNPLTFVNSTLDRFAGSIRMVQWYERAFMAGDANDCDAAAQRIRNDLEQLDQAATDTGTYWDAVIYDSTAGNYSDISDFWISAHHDRLTLEAKSAP